MTRRNSTAKRMRGRRYELTDAAWERIEPLLPRQGRRGKWADHRTTLNGMERQVSGAELRHGMARCSRTL
jgi:transposase